MSYLEIIGIMAVGFIIFGLFGEIVTFICLLGLLIFVFLPIFFIVFIIIVALLIIYLFFHILFKEDRNKTNNIDFAETEISIDGEVLKCDQCPRNASLLTDNKRRCKMHY